jgi:hypothetical protein
MNSFTHTGQNCKKKRTRLKLAMENFSESPEGRLINRHLKPARSCAIEKWIVHPKNYDQNVRIIYEGFREVKESEIPVSLTLISAI